MAHNDDSIVDALDNFLLDRFDEIHTCMPGRINKYEYSTQRAEVKPLLKRAMKNNTQLEYPAISDVPVIFPCTSNTGITFPIKKGDLVLILFAERSLNNWLFSGDDSDTEKARLHNLTDAIAIPGIIPFNQTSKATNNDDLEINHNSQKIVIKENGDIEIGTGTLLQLVTSTFQSLFNTHIHPDPVSGFSGVPTVSMDSAHLTSKVKAQ